MFQFSNHRSSALCGSLNRSTAHSEAGKMLSWQGINVHEGYLDLFRSLPAYQKKQDAYWVVEFSWKSQSLSNHDNLPDSKSYQPFKITNRASRVHVHLTGQTLGRPIMVLYYQNSIGLVLPTQSAWEFLRHGNFPKKNARLRSHTKIFRILRSFESHLNTIGQPLAFLTRF